MSEHLPPTFRFDTNGATVRDLLAMESGIPDPALSATAPMVLADLSREWTAEEVLASVPAHRSPPGDRFVYEDANYMLLGLVIEATTRVSVVLPSQGTVIAVLTNIAGSPVDLVVPVAQDLAASLPG